MKILMPETPLNADDLRQWLIDVGQKWTRYASATSHRGYKQFEVRGAYGHEIFRVIHNEVVQYQDVSLRDALSIYNAIRIIT